MESIVCGNVEKGAAVRFLRYFGRLILEFVAFARENKAWWLIPVILLLLVLGILVVAGQTVAPFIYTLF